MKKTIFIVGGIILALLLAGGFYYWQANQSTKAKLQAEYMQQNKLTRSSFDSGDYATTIANAQDLLSKASNNNQKAQAQLYIASSLASQDQGDNYARAMAMLQKITDDYSVLPIIRALAIHTIASIVIEKNATFYKDNITSAPMNSYLPTSGSEVYKIREAFFKLLQLSDETYPNSSAEYEIAGNYYYWLIVGNNSLSRSDKEKYATSIQKYISEADSRVDDEQESLYSPGGILLGQFYRARSLSLSGEILNNITLEAREEAFKKALGTSDTYKENGSLANPFTLSVSLRTRFYYADFLLTNFGNKRISDIQTTLKPFADTTSLNPLTILGDLKSKPDTDSVKIEALKLAKISPDFDTFLKTIGVKTSQ